jgi:hypothetical protein
MALGPIPAVYAILRQNLIEYSKITQTSARKKEKMMYGLDPMFVERKVCYSALFTNLVGWHAGGVSFPTSDVILAQLACLPE